MEYSALFSISFHKGSCINRFLVIHCYPIIFIKVSDTQTMNEELVEIEVSGGQSGEVEEFVETRPCKNCSLPGNFCFRDEKDPLCQKCQYGCE
jgi:hypothetical protein